LTIPRRFRFRAGRRGKFPSVRTMYTLYWLLILGGIVLWTVVGLTVE
jgi:hypothetical protein